MKVFLLPKKDSAPTGFLPVCRILIFLLLLTGLVVPVIAFPQNAPLKFTPIPYSEPDIISPGRGAEQWENGSEKVNNPIADTNHKPLDVYSRFPWTRLEDSVAGKYNWTYFDNLVKDAIDHRQKISFGIMPVYDGEGTVVYDSARSAYPLYLHKLMQAGTATTRDWISNGVWIPNWNHSSYLTRLRALHIALNAHILNTSYKGVAFKNVIYCIDVRGYGNYGEWHSAGIVDHVSQYPTGRRATIATLKTIINHHTQVFTQWPLTLMIATFDADQYDAIMNPAEVTYHALTTKNTWGPLGWRRDQWGATDIYLDKILKNNEKKYGTSPAFRVWITSRYLTSPITGEPPRYVNPGGVCEYWNLEQQLADYGATSLGNGNWGIKLTECGQQNAREAFKRAGYRIILEGGAVTSTMSVGKPFSVSLQWKNTGIAPTYEKWDVMFELKNDSNKVVWSGMSKFKPKLFAPADTATSVTDTFHLPSSVPLDQYKLNLIIKDPTGYRAPLPLAITGKNDDGSYTLKEITASPFNCAAPVAVISSSPTCNGQATTLILDSAGGGSSYDLVINGNTYNEVLPGQVITTISAPTEKIWSINPSPKSTIDSPVELGVKFKSSVPGHVRGIRFYSSDNPSGRYTGHLWTTTGILLDSVVFSNISPNSWQEALFKTPYLIKADTTYVVSYHTSSGNYAATSQGLNTGSVNGSLIIPPGDSNGGNGVYGYGTSASFPVNSYNATNYWADVLFTPSIFTINLTSITDNNGCSNDGILQTLVIAPDSHCDTVPPTTQPTATLGSSSACNGGTIALVLDSANGNGPFDLVINGSTYHDVEPGETITTVTPPIQKIWDTVPAPVSHLDSPVELGIKFKSSEAGFIRGIRFFSSDNPSGIYTGHLWTASGVLLDSLVFTNVTPNSWQEALFANPPLIDAGSTYIVSYHTAGGRYAASSAALRNTVTSGALTVPGDNSSNANGLYGYGPSGSFPTHSYNATNYWADVLFIKDTVYTYTFNLTSVTDELGSTKKGTLQTLSITTTECLQGRPAATNPVAQRPKSSQTQDLLSSEQEANTKGFDLRQNFPNPVNHETIIQYSLPEPAKVNLSLYDMNGRLLKVLVNEWKDRGSFSITVRKGLLSGGMYFYRMHTGDFSAVRKMIVVH